MVIEGTVSGVSVVADETGSVSVLTVKNFDQNNELVAEFAPYNDQSACEVYVRHLSDYSMKGMTLDKEGVKNLIDHLQIIHRHMT